MADKFEIIDTEKIKEFNFLMAEPKYEEQMKELWARCFPEDAHGFVDFYFANCYRRQSAYLAVRGGKVCAMVYAPLMKYHMCGVDFTVPYIQGVATSPECRNLGLANALLAHALNHLRNLGAPFGILKPFRVDFYERSGWRVFAGLAEVRCDTPEQMLDKLATPAAMANFTDFTTEENLRLDELSCRRVADINDIAQVDLPGLSTIFENWQQAHRNNYPLREAHDWQLLLADHFTDGGEMWLVEHDGKALAYALVNCGNTKEDEIFIRELAAVGKISLAFLLDELRCWLTAKPMRLNLPANQRLADDFRLIPFAMARVINAETFLSACSLGLPTDEERIFRLSDPVIPGNSRIFAVSGGDGGSNCRILDKNSAADSGALGNMDENVDLAKKIPEINVNLLTSLLFRWYNDNKEMENKQNLLEPPQDGVDGSYFNEYFR